MFNTILVATDGSDNANRAVKWAAELAKTTDARLSVVHTLLRDKLPEAWVHMAEVEHLLDAERTAPPPALDISAGFAFANNGGSNKKIINQKVAAEVGKNVLAHARQLAKDAGLQNVQTCARSGDPARDVLEEAKSVGADLIVVGSRGLGGLKGLLMGSVSSKVSHLAEVPTVTVK